VQVLEEGTATVELRPSNAVLSVAIGRECIPMQPVQAGSSLQLVVQVETEDHQPLSIDDAQKGLALSLIAPGANSRAAQVGLLPTCYSGAAISVTAELLHECCGLLCHVQAFCSQVSYSATV
jgi:hypothetical protein